MNYHLIELANGTLAVMFTWMFIYGALHVGRCYKSAHDGIRNGKATVWRSVKHLYKNNKPEVALLVIVGSLTLRTWTLWYLRFVDNHNFDGWKLLTTSGTEIVIVATFSVAWGIMCWIKVITPYKYENRAIWILLSVIAILFGFASVLLPDYW